ncbi:MAG: DNA gyrase subunit A [candidate division Zixibacteria bacterium]|nr:DNA gyrase subunit A [candidate division Zixibacteria bacterium]
MPLERETIKRIFLEEEMKGSYLDYSMSVITQRALPNVADGLKPSNRRILVAMNDLNLAPGGSHRKCAKICGDTSGNYHPHGEQVVYPTLVRMAQGFNMRYVLVDGQGNFGSIDGDSAAAMRYTEARMSAMAVEMLADMEKNTVDMMRNYDNTLDEPVVLPGRFPNLICNGSSGIAVGMATNIPPHNLTEVVDGLCALIEDEDLEDEKILELVPGPDFPTSGLIVGRAGIENAYRTGRGTVTVRAKANVENQPNGKQSIIVSEIPYQVNKSNLLEKVADLVRDKKLDGIADLRDESDRDGMRIVFDLKRDAIPEVVLNNLYKHTLLQTTFGIINLALVDGVPRVLTLRQMMEEFLKHRHLVIQRRTQFDLNKAEARAHILEGYKIALDNIDAIIKLIRGSQTPAEAKQGLVDNFGLTDIQAQAILDMRLQRLTGLERDKIEKEYLEVIQAIEEYRSILASKQKRMRIVRDELLELKKKYGDVRRTQIIEAEEEFSIEDLIAEEDVVITISHEGYIKRLTVSAYRRQNRGGRGVRGIEMKDTDFVEHLFVASTHDYILFFTTAGRCYWLKVHEIPTGGRMAKGKNIANLLQLQPKEYITAFEPIKNFTDTDYIVMATRNGTIKKTVLSAFAHPRKAGINAMDLPEDDALIETGISDGDNEIILATRSGQAVRFHEDQVRPMGRGAYGVRGVALGKDDRVVGMVVVKRPTTLLTVTEKGFGKRSEIGGYRLTKRGGKGVINIKASERNGKVVAVKEVVDDDELMIITHKGIIIRMGVSKLRVMGRATQGVRLISLDSEDVVIDVARVITAEEGSVENGTAGNGFKGGDATKK